MIKRLSACIRQYKKDTILTPIFMAVEVAFEVLIPFLMADIIDSISSGNMSNVLLVGTGLVIIAFICMLLGSLSGVYGAKASSGFARNLRRDIYHSIQGFSFSNVDKFSVSSLVTRLTTDITNIQNAFLMIIRLAVRSPIMLILAMVMSFQVNVKLSMIFLGVVPVLGIGLYCIIKSVFPIFGRVFKTYDRLNKIVQENVRGIRVVKSFVREENETKKFRDISGDIYKDFTKAEKTISFNMPLMQLCMYACMILAAWIGAKLIVGSEMTTGQLMSIITYAMQILMSLMMLSMVFVMVTISKASAERVVEVLDEKSNLTNCDNPEFEVKDGSICFKDVSFSYSGDKSKLSLSNINLQIKEGETIGIIGGTGSSKSTLVQLVPRLYDATEGCVMVGGVDVRNIDLETLRNSVAVVLQKNTLFSGTIKENLRWGNEKASDEELVNACKLAHADEFIQTFSDGYDTYIEQGGSNVSGGQRQRLCIARALLKNPKILILDDSTSAVDTKTDSFIRKAFRTEIPNTTKIIVAQRISSVQDADRIIVMEGGRINGIGSHEELLINNKIYAEVYNSQMKGADFDEAN